MAYAYSKLYNIPLTGLRFFTVYGTAGRPDMAYFGFTNKLINGEKIQIFNYGNCMRDYTYVTDRKGHDMRYAIDPTKIHNELGWLPETKFADGIKKTIQWYLDNKEWWETIISGEYQDYYDKMYGSR